MCSLGKRKTLSPEEMTAGFLWEEGRQAKDSGLFQQDNAPWHTAQINMTKVLHGLQIPQISVRFSIYGMCWTNKSNPRSPSLHLAIKRICSQCLGARYHRTHSKVLWSLCLDISELFRHHKWDPHDIKQVVLMSWLISVYDQLYH